MLGRETKIWALRTNDKGTMQDRCNHFAKQVKHHYRLEKHEQARTPSRIQEKSDQVVFQAVILVQEALHSQAQAYHLQHVDGCT